ncbi:MAG: DUF433 domain-containing protein [Caulobacterales bacterium]|uniref:DUF433 domain-containing protein n=1 Tax=Glycocaulis sp. TaxID=1969725 RepID=UPI003F9F683B
MTGNLIDRITIDPTVMGGQPCVRGLRMRVGDILDLLASGMTEEAVLTDYPYLERDDIRAALAYASRLAGHRIIAAE